MKAAILLALLLAACASSPLQLYSHARSQTFLVTVPSGHGSGVVINDYCVLTAGHVADDNTDITLTADNGKEFAAVPRAIDKVADIAVICSAKKLDVAPVLISKAMPAQYDSVFVIGFPLDESKVLTTGQYQLNSLITAPSAPGSSGGPVFDADGHWVGLVDTISLYSSPVGVLTFGHMVGIIEIGPVRKFLDDNKISYTNA